MNFNSGFDWNGNGKHDSFDDFMNMKIASDNMENSCKLDKYDDETDELSDNIQKSYHQKRQQSDEGKPVILLGNKPIYDSSKDSNGVVILKSFLVVALCVAGFVIPIMLELGSIGIALCLFGAVAASIAILNNTEKTK